MISRISLTLGALLLAAIVSLALVTFHYHGKATTQAATIASLNQQKNEAEFISQAQAQTIGIFNTIAGATLDKQKANTMASEDRQVIIKTVFKTEPCALVPIPAAVASSLLKHYDSVR